MQTRFKHAYVLNVLSDDHPGIIAAVGRAVSALGGNIDACSQTVLSAYFTLIMIVSLPEPTDADGLVAEVRGPQGAAAGLQIVARRLVPPAGGAAGGPGDRFVITAFGADRPGIVLRFSQYLAAKDINNIDMYGNRTGEDFVLIAQVEIPARWEIAVLQADLEQIARQERYTVRLQHENIFVATNQLRLTH